MLAIENNVYVLSKRYQVNGREILKILEIAIAMLYASYHHEEYNYEDIASEDIIYLAHIIAHNLNGYVNEELKEQFLQENHVDMNDPSIRKRMFSMSIICLVRVKESVEFWMKKWGSEGYITYISTFLEA